MKTSLLIFVAGLGLMSACSNSGSNYTPIIDGAPQVNFQPDLAACQSLARSQRQFDQETLGATVLGAAAGAALGEADNDDALGGALAGALVGGGSAAVTNHDRRQQIVISCMRGRGHAVVG